MSSIRATIGSLSSVPTDRCCRFGAAKGSGDGQFNDPTSVAVDPATNKIYVADPINKRIQVFDSNGKFLDQMVSARMGTAGRL